MRLAFVWSDKPTGPMPNDLSGPVLRKCLENDDSMRPKKLYRNGEEKVVSGAAYRLAKNIEEMHDRMTKWHGAKVEVTEDLLDWLELPYVDADSLTASVLTGHTEIGKQRFFKKARKALNAHPQYSRALRELGYESLDMEIRTW